MISRSPAPWISAGVIVTSVTVGLLIAILISVQAMLPLAAFAGLGLVLATLSLSKEVMLWILMLSALVLGGTVSYFAGVGQAQWLPIGIAAAMGVSVLLHLVGRIGNAEARPISLGMSLLVAFVVLLSASTAWEMVSLPHWLYGLRFYCAMAVVMVALSIQSWSADTIRKLWVAMALIALLQLPVALFQYLLVAGRRLELGVDGVAWDAVVGTMGGKQEGGGQSAALGFFCVAMFVVVFTWWKRGLVSMWRALGFSVAMLAVIFLAEVKAMVIIMPLAVMLVLRADVLKHIRQVVAGGLIVMLLLLAMPWLYSKLHYERAGQSAVTTTEFYARIVDNSDSEHFNKGTQQLGRVAQLAFWWDRNDLFADPKRFLLGHGMGTTNAARVYAGDLVREYFPLSVTNTAGGILLWEAGLIGIALVLAAILVTARLSFGLSRSQALPVVHRAALEAGGVILIVLLPALFYKHFALKSPAVQFVVFLAAGQVYYWRAELSRRARIQRREAVAARFGAVGSVR